MSRWSLCTSARPIRCLKRICWRIRQERSCSSVDAPSIVLSVALCGLNLRVSPLPAQSWRAPNPCSGKSNLSASLYLSCTLDNLCLRPVITRARSAAARRPKRPTSRSSTRTSIARRARPAAARPLRATELAQVIRHLAIARQDHGIRVYAGCGIASPGERDCAALRMRDLLGLGSAPSWHQARRSPRLPRGPRPRCERTVGPRNM